MDINLTPDKRHALINNEKVVLLAVKRALRNTFGAEPGKFQVMNINQSVKNHPKNPSKSDSEDEEDEIVVMPLSYNFPHALKMFKSKGVTASNSGNKRKSSSLTNENSLKMPKIDKFFTQPTRPGLSGGVQISIESEFIESSINSSEVIFVK